MTSYLDAVYRSLANKRRRYILTFLRESEAEVTRLDDLVDYVVQQETHSPSPDRETIRIDLYHVHLPLLADAGVIDFDARSEMVQYNGHERIEDELDREQFSQTTEKSHRTSES